MAWCPVCKCEYKDGIIKCADCNVELVDSLETQCVKMPDSIDDTEESEMEAVYFGADEMKENKALHFLDREAQIPAVRIVKKSGVYRDSAELSNENKYSAYILLSVGILGVLTLVLICFDILPIYTGVTAKIITSSVMGSLFLVFIIMGVVSLKNAKKFQEKAATEGNLTKEIMDYCLKNLSEKKVDDSIRDEQWDEEDSDEIKYFKRVEYIRDVITKQFMNLEEEYVDFMCDEVYVKLYEE